MPQFIVYMTSAFDCPYCVKVKNALIEKSYTYEERDISIPVNKIELLERYPSVRTIPQVFTRDGEHIGGCDDLLSLIDQNLLEIVYDIKGEN